MPAFSKIALFSSLIAYVSAQQAGSVTAETHPGLTSSVCTRSGTTNTCTTKSTKVVIDGNWRWLRNNQANQYNNCYTGNSFDATLCPSNTACAQNCALEGSDYSGTYGITTSGNALTLKFVTRSSTTNVGSRVYLMDTDTSYNMFNFMDSNSQEFAFDVDVSNMPCGVNAALYTVEMKANGGLNTANNKAGAKFGTGYCDAQCPHDLKFIEGSGNVEGWTPSSTDSNAGFGKAGACCNEMDIWEANSISNAYTPHPCKNIVGVSRCEDPVTCGDGSNRYAGVCDKDGCDFNPYRQGNHDFYGPGKTVDTTKKITVITQFIKDSSSNLVEIRRAWVQNNQVILQSKNEWAGIGDYNSITDDYCVKQKSVFGDNSYFVSPGGGLVEMGKSLARGHVLALSIWADHAAHLLWLNSPYPVDKDPSLPGVARGTCSTTSGDPNELINSAPNSSVTYSNIKVGQLCSTFPSGVTIPDSLCGGYIPPSGKFLQAPIRIP
ncbi:hypothetical protein TWF481_005068 [Arthrobotrys musiformis]|uniref:Glucanase n=1 Tax=Arthrobotrys musiformis TaxID=47236 RepID=A0AAV9WDK1_9PEZI